MSEIEGISDQLAAIAELDHVLTQHWLPYWLFGGWAVEFHVGRVTREHDGAGSSVGVHIRERWTEWRC